MFILGLLTGLVIGLALFVILTFLSSLGNLKAQNEMHEENKEMHRETIDVCDTANQLRSIRNDKLEALLRIYGQTGDHRIFR